MAEAQQVPTDTNPLVTEADMRAMAEKELGELAARRQSEGITEAEFVEMVDLAQRAELRSGKANTAAVEQPEWLLLRGYNPAFRVLYPNDWRLGTPRGPNVRLTLFPPEGEPRGNCNLVVRHEPELSGNTQAQLNNLIETVPLTREDWMQLLGRWPDTKIEVSTQTRVHNQPAYLGVIEFSNTTVDRKTYIRGMQLVTFTPNYVWHFSCAGKGDTAVEARRSYEVWEATFRRIFGSLVFEQ